VLVFGESKIGAEAGWVCALRSDGAGHEQSLEGVLNPNLSQPDAALSFPVPMLAIGVCHLSRLALNPDPIALGYSVVWARPPAGNLRMFYHGVFYRRQNQSAERCGNATAGLVRGENSVSGWLDLFVFLPSWWSRPNMLRCRALRPSGRAS